MPVNGLEQTHIKELAEKLAPLGSALKMPKHDTGQGTRVSIIDARLAAQEALRDAASRQRPCGRPRRSAS